jgi:hypothetical protein
VVGGEGGPVLAPSSFFSVLCSSTFSHGSRRLSVVRRASCVLLFVCLLVSFAPFVFPRHQTFASYDARGRLCLKGETSHFGSIGTLGLGLGVDVRCVCCVSCRAVCCIGCVICVVCVF